MASPGEPRRRSRYPCPSVACRRHRPVDNVHDQPGSAQVGGEPGSEGRCQRLKRSTDQTAFTSMSHRPQLRPARCWGIASPCGSCDAAHGSLRGTELSVPHRESERRDHRPDRFHRVATDCLDRWPRHRPACHLGAGRPDQPHRQGNQGGTGTFIRPGSPKNHPAKTTRFPKDM